MKEFRLPAETVVRQPPVNLAPQDQNLFAHEYEKSFGEVQAVLGTWDFSSEGLLLKSGTGRVDPLSFQQGLPTGKAGLKVQLKGQLYRWTQPRVTIHPQAGRKFLVITDEFSNGYFHWVTDGLPKLALWGDELEKYELVLPAFTQRFGYMLKSLSAWPQLNVRVVNDKERTALEEAVLIPALAPTGNYRPASIRVLGETWRTLVGAGEPTRKLYVSRAKAPWRKIRNEAEVQSYLEQQGFETVYLEDLSFEQQVKLLAETAQLVSNHGAGLTNLLFQREGGRVLEIRQRGDAHNNCYYALANASGLKYSYMLADPVNAQEDTHTADVRVDLNALKVAVESW